MTPSDGHQTRSLTQAYGLLWRDWVRPYRRSLGVILILMAISAASAAGFSKLVQVVIAALEAGLPSVMYWGPLAIIGLALVKGGTQYLQTRRNNKVLRGVERALQGRMYHDLVHADLARLADKAPPALATRFSADIMVIGSAMGQVLGGLGAMLVVIATFAVMLSIDWAMTLAITAIFALALVPVNVIGRKVRELSRSTQSQIGKMSASVSEGLAGIRMARTYQLEKPLIEGANEVFDRLVELKLKQANWQARVGPMMDVLSGLAIAALLFLVGWRMTRGTTTLADFMGLLTGLGVVASPAQRLGMVFTGMQQGRAALERVYALFDAKNLIIDAAKPVAMARAKGAIGFEKVSFAYPGGKLAVQDLTLNIAPGEKIALVGRSGAGKTTIFNLLPRLYDPTAGTITLDGVNLRDLSLTDLRRQIAVVGQDSVLLSATVAQNIGFGRPGATQAEIEAAAKAASADAFIRALPEGYDTMINPSAASFSGGERQRLSIARAILRAAPVLLLDEPTSALDAETEAAIKAALDRLAEGCTTLVIAHRLATVLDADRIVVLDNGQIADIGTHAALLKSGGQYAELYRLQFQS